MGGGDTATRPDPSPSGAMACNAIPGGSARPRHHPTPAGTTTAPCPSRRPCLPRSPDEEGPTLDRAARPLDYGRRLWRTPEGVPPQPAQAAGLPAGREWGGGRYTTGSLASRVLPFGSAETRPPCPRPPRGQSPWCARRTRGPADPRTLMEPRGVRLPRTDDS